MSLKMSETMECIAGLVGGTWAKLGADSNRMGMGNAPPCQGLRF